MLKQVLFNVEELDVRVAVLEDGILAELFVENLQSRSMIGNVYKGRVEGIVPGLKAVFVNIGHEKNAFLHFNDVLPEYNLPERGHPQRAPRSAAGASELVDLTDDEDDFVDPCLPDKDDLEAMEAGAEEAEAEGEEAPVRPVKHRPARRSRQLKVGDEILVQVTKESFSTKGPRITTFISLPGRYMVYMPLSDNGGGVSRRIDEMDERKRLRRILKQIHPDQGSLIIRTAATEQDEESLTHDAQLLAQKWQTIQRRAGKCRAPACLHDDQDILTRVVRDNFSTDIDEILVDSKTALRQLVLACQEMLPEVAHKVHLFDSVRNIFDTFEVETQFRKALKRKVWLRSGGQIVIDETEALTAIDINTGKFVGQGDQDSVILKTNLEACRAIARQLRLRDLGGLVVIDFIDMNSRDHENQVLREFKRCLRQDRAKFTVSGFSEFGMVEMTRKRVRKSLASSLYVPCPYCEGSGRIMNSAQLWKLLKYDLIAELENKRDVEYAEIIVHSQFRTYLQEQVREGLAAVAGKYQVGLNIVGDNDLHHEQYKIITHAKSTEEKEKPKSSGSRPRRRRGGEKKLESTGSPQDNAS